MLARICKGKSVVDSVLPFTCRRPFTSGGSSTYYSSRGAPSSNSFASTSQATLDHAPSFDHLTTSTAKWPPRFGYFLPKQAVPAPHASSSAKARQRRRQQGRPDHLVALVPKRPVVRAGGASASNHRSSSPSKWSSNNRVDQQISPYLPLVTRERSHLLFQLRSALASTTPSPERTWSTLTEVIRYPNVLPDLPASSYSTSYRVAIDEYNPVQDPRKPIRLSLSELRRTFDILSSARPATWKHLTKLLVLVELYALHGDASTTPAVGANTNADLGKNSLLTPFTADAASVLRQCDLRALMIFAGANIRSPRRQIELENALTMFGHIRGEIGIKTFNTLLNLASLARAWDLYDNAQARMHSMRIHDDVATVGIRMMMMLRRGANLDAIWREFVRGVQRYGPEQSDQRLWGSMVWCFARRGKMEEAMRLFSTMQQRSENGHQVDLLALGPQQTRFDHHDDGTIPTLWVHARRPDRSTFEGLVQAFAHYGDLASALAVMREMLGSDPPIAPSHQTYASLFRGFTRHGRAPSGLASRHLHGGVYSTDRGNLSAYREAPLSALSSLVTGNARPTQPGVDWTLEVLDSLFDGFIASSPASTTDSAGLPFQGARSAPQPAQLFWLVLAYEVMTGNDSTVVLDRWARVERVFNRTDRSEWKGWKVDGRLQRKLEAHRLSVEGS
ncbi:BZ3500_MvSof-1268-A1-R1_Chr2-1g04507 [Microbotryum saponariae]|uniref:BZ3500_MvSof-1268-A1-R1_Chr2-1g04507 protein n=1 Tax=Microbotryum saponariae TaxID=289078 RepID=A0A2X0MBR4_9BASI|nr:BZ3500_MvSof-1268-A1-R1_Chr2-1g04507 [Microbotryum saponariae]SCZ91873.1 BZ3501_MvSof-1269-A2-R1_Chr2-1g04163 [Microbotryum saponariae]